MARRLRRVCPWARSILALALVTIVLLQLSRCVFCSRSVARGSGLMGTLLCPPAPEIKYSRSPAAFGAGVPLSAFGAGVPQGIYPQVAPRGAAGRVCVEGH